MITARPLGKKGACCAGQDIHDARRVAANLGISPTMCWTMKQRFQDTQVMEDFVGQLRGLAKHQIPCVMCNERVKFRDMFDTAQRTRGRCLGDRSLYFQPV